MSLIPYLYYEDVGAALAFLSRAFGFRKYGRPMRRPDGVINHAAMKVGADMIMMGRPPDPKFRNPKRMRQATQSLYITVKNVDKHFEIARKAGARIIEEPLDTFYGQRRYGAEDPEGHQWYFAHGVKKPAPKKRIPSRVR